MRDWWGKRRQMVLPGRGGTPEEDRRRKSINPGFWRSYHNTLMLGKLRQAVRRATNKEGVECLLTGKKMHKDRATSFRGPMGESPGHASLP